MTPAQILKALCRRLVPLAARGLTPAEMRRELAYTVRRFKLSEKVTSALMERVEGELSYVATRTVGADTRRAAVELVRPFAGPVSRLDGALLQQFERRVLPLVEKGARVSDVEARIRRAVGVTEVSAKTLASTVVAGADRAGSLLAAQEAGVTHFRYAGPPGERRFCSDLTRRSANGETWTLEQIRAMVNGHGLPVEFYCGGYRCRHRWVSAVGPAPLARPLQERARVLRSEGFSRVTVFPSGGFVAWKRTFLHRLSRFRVSGDLPELENYRQELRAALAMAENGYEVRFDDALMTNFKGPADMSVFKVVTDVKTITTTPEKDDALLKRVKNTRKRTDEGKLEYQSDWFVLQLENKPDDQTFESNVRELERWVLRPYWRHGKSSRRVFVILHDTHPPTVHDIHPPPP